MPHRGEDALRFADAHVHLSDYEDSTQEIGYARANGAILFSAGIDEPSSRISVSLASKHPGIVRAFVGIHPSEATKSEDESWVQKLLARASGLGEVGMDPGYSPAAEGGRQRTLFGAQLSAAEKQKKPVQVHSRGAEKEVLDVLSSHRLDRVLLHWFQGESEASLAVEKGYFVSFGPALILSKKLQRIARTWARDRILVETDGPVPFSALGGAGGSWLIPSVVYRLSELLELEFSECARVVFDNSLDFLGSKA